MKKIILCVLLVAGIGMVNAQTDKEYKRLYRKTERKLNKQTRKAEKAMRGIVIEATPLEWWADQYMATMDPILGRPTPEVLIAYMNSKTMAGNNASVLPGTTSNPWAERGPNNVGGRTRGLVWDKINSNKVWAGGVTGGLWYNDNITSTSSSWVHVSGLWSNLNVTCIAFDPQNDGIMYIGTGEGFGTTASTSRGAGIWKSTDTGKTFAQISSTKDFYYINDIVIRKESSTSVLYVAVDAIFFGGQWNGLSDYGLKRSINGGTSWSTVGPKISTVNMAIADFEIGSNGRIWAGSRKHPYGLTDKGGGRIIYSDNGTTWSTAYTHSTNTGRVSIACAPNDSNYVYALVEETGTLDAVVRTTDEGANWSSRTEPSDADNGIPNTDFTRGQAWYDLVIAVDPNDKNVVIAGVIDLFRSTDGANNWTQISKWSNNNNLSGLSCPLVHADQHAIIFKKGSSSTCLIGNDGGVYYSSNISNAGTTSSAIVERNKNYNVTQYYWGDIANTSGSHNMLAGAQDNGTQKFTTAGVNTTTNVSGGDGGYCFIDKTNSNKQISSYVYNNFYYTTNNWSSSSNFITDNTGRFINCAEWDNTKSGLISNKSNGELYRRTLISTTPGTLETVSYASTDYATALKAVKLGNGNTRLWVGDNKGEIWFTDDFWATTPTFTKRTGTINNGTISDIYNWNSGDTLFVTLSNYGVNNIYYSANKGTSWSVKDGNLPNIPVWSLLLNPNNPKEAIVGTEIGIFATENIFATTPVWSEYTEGMGNVKIATLRLRSTDNEIMAVTHGRGVFTSSAFEAKAPSTDFSADYTQLCSDEVITFTDASMFDPTSWAWSFVPYGKASYVNGTDSTSQNPQVILKAGTYSAILKASNSTGNNVKIRTSYITVKDTFTPQIIASGSFSNLCDGDNITINAAYSNILSANIKNQYWSDLTGKTAYSGTSASFPVKSNTSYKLIATTTEVCSLLDSFESNIVMPNAGSILNISVGIDNSPVIACQGNPLNVSATATGNSSSNSVEWFINNISIGKGLSKTIVTPVTGDEVKVVLSESGACVRPSNSVEITSNISVSPKPSTPNIRVSWDTIYATYTGMGSIVWFRNNTQVGTGDFLKLTSNGYYSAYLKNGNCIGDSALGINYNSINVKLINAQGLSIYPNPANDYLIIESVLGMKLVKLQAINGQVVFEENLKGKSVYKMTIPSEIKGNMVLSITLGNGQVHNKMIEIIR